MKTLLSSMLLIWYSGTFGQGLIKPVMTIEDASLKTFLSDLNRAIAEKDKEFILLHMSSDMVNSFGGDGGIEEFKDYWNFLSDSSEFWDVAEKIISLGGGNYENGDTYALPYVFSDWPDNGDYDVFECMAITGEAVNVRNLPSSDANVLGKLSHDIVKVDWDKSYPPFNAIKIEGLQYVGDKLWYYIESLEGSLKGYVYWDYIWSPIGYRMGFEKIEGKWAISYFLSGD
ncbi:MAG: hypothetical protein RID18_00160 [Cytophagales bacterium]